MNYIRMTEDRGQASFGWLESRHSFSFGGYHDPDHMGVSKLRVINGHGLTPGLGAFEARESMDRSLTLYRTMIRLVLRLI